MESCRFSFLGFPPTDIHFRKISVAWTGIETMKDEKIFSPSYRITNYTIFGVVPYYLSGLIIIEMGVGGDGELALHVGRATGSKSFYIIHFSYSGLFTEPWGKILQKYCLVLLVFVASCYKISAIIFQSEAYPNKFPIILEN